MKNAGRIILIVVVALLLMGSSVQAQLDANADVEVYAEILDTITIDPTGAGTQDMDFSFGTSPQGGSAEITLGLDGSLALNAAAGVDVFWNDTGTPAVVNVAGTASRAYVVEIGSTEVTRAVSTTAGTPSVTLTDGTDTLTVDRFLVEGNSFVNGGFQLDTGGIDTLTIGAVLTVPATVSVGNYEGDFNLTVSYE